jgi:hypothetical protein
MSLRISIVIPARNDAAALARTLDHLVAMEGATRAEIIVAGAILTPTGYPLRSRKNL